MSTQTITPKSLYDLISKGNSVHLVDVRTSAEFQEIHVDVAKNVPLDRLDPAALGLDAQSHQPLYVICRSGARGSQACQSLLRAGLPNVVNVEGGTMAWAQAGLPVIRGKKSVSIDRQVRMIAGSLVLLASILAVTLDARWGILSGLIGAGLLHAGLSDSCMMGMCLAKMPWNQAKS
jgi:rhodanese-related sulfurtransferase